MPKPTFRLWLAALLMVIGAQPILAQAGKAQPAANKTCERYTLQGKLFYQTGQFDAAYVAFRQCLSLEPNNAEALYNVGRVEIRLELYSAAIDHFKKAISLDAKFFSAYIGLSQAYSRQFVESKVRSAMVGQLDEAFRVLDDAERIADNSTEKGLVHNERGLIYGYKNDLEKALESYKKALTFMPDSAPILFNLGTVQLKTGRVVDCIETMRKAVDLEPRNASNRAYLAKALRLNKELKSALSEATQAFNLAGGMKGKDAFVAGQYGITQYENKNLAVAKNALELAIKIDDHSIYHENYYYLGRLNLEASQPREARAQFSKAVFIEPLEPLYWYWLGQANEASGLKEDACKSYNQALKVKADYKDAQAAAGALKCPAVASAR